MARDIGGYFEQMTRKARGGRRLEADDVAEPHDDANAEPTPEPSSGGLGDMLKDILRKGRSTATNAGKTATKSTKRVTKTATEKARDRLRRTPARTTSSRRARPPEGVVTIEYAPRVDGDPDPGEVVWTWVPYEEDPEQGKDRPVVVIGRRNRSLVGVPLTTRQNDREAQVSIGTGGWDPDRRTSYARIWRLLDIDADKTRREGAVLERDRFEAVVTAVDEYYDIRRPAADADDFDYDY